MELKSVSSLRVRKWQASCCFQKCACLLQAPQDAGVCDLLKKQTELPHPPSSIAGAEEKDVETPPQDH